MVVTRLMSGTTKKADTKVAVNHKVAERASKKRTAERERASKKTSAKRKRARKKLTTASRKEMQLNQKACDLFIKETFLPQYSKEHPDIVMTVAKNLEVMVYGYNKWNDSMTDNDKAPYFDKVKKMEAEEMAFIEDFKQEAGNVPYVVENGFGKYSKSPKEIASLVAQWFDPKADELGIMSQNALRFARPDAVFKIVHDLHQLVRERSCLPRYSCAT